MKRVQVDITIWKVNKNGVRVRILERVEAATIEPKVAAELLRDIAKDLESDQS